MAKFRIFDLELSEPRDGKNVSLERQCLARFILGEHVQRLPTELTLRNIAARIDNISGASLGSAEYQNRSTDKTIYRPSYWYHEVRIFWSRPLSGDSEDRAAVEEESYKALEAAVDAVVAAGYDLMERPD